MEEKMNTFDVYDQRHPVYNNRLKEFEANLPFCGQLRAKDEAAAIEEAKVRRWSRWPMVRKFEEKKFVP